MSDAQRPGTWRPFKKGLCDGCWAGCCTLPLEATAKDLIRLGLATQDEADESLPKLAKRLEKARLIQRFHAPSELFTIAQRAGRDCIFLDEESRLCTVYEIRPDVCRKFPKELGPRPGFCPYKSKTADL